jgi:CheY-like chemotaxis protein
LAEFLAKAQAMSSSPALSVLIVDDHQDAAESMARVVRAAGHRAQAAYSSGEAVNRVRAGFVPDAVLMDIGLPDTDGFAAAREVCRGLARRPLLVALTGHSDLDRRTREEGFGVYFVKPVEPDLVLGVLEGHAARLERDRTASGTAVAPN